MSPLTVGSLFSGIGGLDLGLERAGMKIVWQVEKDPYAQKVLRKHWPKTWIFGDIHEVSKYCLGIIGGAQVDVLCGGFPCQDISNAGKRAGINGSRSGLWAEYARIIDEIRPSWVIIENVPALRSRGLGRVLSDLSASGYDAEWDGVSAAHVGAPHRRDRIWVVAYPKCEPLRVEPGRGGGAHRQGPLVFGCDGFSWPIAGARSWASSSLVCRSGDGVPARMERLRGLGNAVVPAVAEFVGRLVVSAAAA